MKFEEKIPQMHVRKYCYYAYTLAHPKKNSWATGNNSKENEIDRPRQRSIYNCIKWLHKTIQPPHAETPREWAASHL